MLAPHLPARSSLIGILAAKAPQPSADKQDLLQVSWTHLRAQSTQAIKEATVLAAARALPSISGRHWSQPWPCSGAILVRGHIHHANDAWSSPTCLLNSPYFESRCGCHASGISKTTSTTWRQQGLAERTWRTVKKNTRAAFEPSSKQVGMAQWQLYSIKHAPLHLLQPSNVFPLHLPHPQKYS